MIEIDTTVFIHSASVQHGNVKVGAAGLWPCSVIRGDLGPARVSRFTNIQDNYVVHAGIVGDFVTVAHGTIIHGCTLGN